MIEMNIDLLWEVRKTRWTTIQSCSAYQSLILTISTQSYACVVVRWLDLEQIEQCVECIVVWPQQHDASVGVAQHFAVIWRERVTVAPLCAKIVKEILLMRCILAAMQVHQLGHKRELLALFSHVKQLVDIATHN